MARIHWRNSEMSLFMMDAVEDNEDWPIYIPIVSIRNVSWGPGNTACQYCGEMRIVKEGRCVNCGSSSVVPSGLSGLAIVEMYGRMPGARDLFNIRQGSQLEVCWLRPNDPRMNYHRDGVILKMTHCKVIQRDLPNLIVVDPTELDVVRVLVRIECNAELLLPEKSK